MILVGIISLYVTYKICKMYNKRMKDIADKVTLYLIITGMLTLIYLPINEYIAQQTNFQYYIEKPQKEERLRTKYRDKWSGFIEEDPRYVYYRLKDSNLVDGIRRKRIGDIDIIKVNNGEPRIITHGYKLRNFTSYLFHIPIRGKRYEIKLPENLGSEF